MKKLILLIASLALACQAEEGFREFTASDGRKLKAKIISYDGTTDKVQIQREDTKTMTASSSAFSEADQSYIKKWSATGLFASTAKFKLELRRNEADSTKKEYNVDMTDVEDDDSGGGRRGGGDGGVQTVATDKNTKYKYDLTLSNKGGVPLENLTMEYRIYYEQEKAVKEEDEKRKEDDTRPERYSPVSEDKVKDGKVKIGTIEAKGTKEVSTDSITLVERTANRRYEDKINLKAELVGAWVKIYMKAPDGQTLERDIALPESIMKKIPWDPEEAPQKD